MIFQLSESMMKNYLRTLGMGALLLLLIAGSCIIAGCTGDSAPEATSAPTTQPTATATTSAPASSGEVVHFTKLYPFFPTPTENWVAENPSGMTMSSAEGEWSFAQRTYTQQTNEEVVVNIVIQDTGGQQVGYSQAWNTYMEVDTPEMSWRHITVQGYPAWEFHDKMDNVYTQIIAVNDRFFVWINIENGKQAYLTVFNNGLDLKGLAALA
jgi:hypothetical protein